MVNPEVVLFLNKGIMSGDVEFFLAERTQGGSYIAKPPEFELIKESVSVDYPTFRLSEASSERLMNDLWAMGFRPKDFRDETGIVAAQKEHISGPAQGDAGHVIGGKKWLKTARCSRWCSCIIRSRR